MDRHFEIETAAARPGPAIIDVTSETLLPAIEIDGGDALASLYRGNGDIHCERGFT
jgi:hypothetical protein